MDLEKIIDIASFIYNSEEIPKEGLKITYELPMDVHKQLDKELFENTGSKSEPIYNEIIELKLDDIVFNFLIKK
jgi:hypothetical protein